MRSAVQEMIRNGLPVLLRDEMHRRVDRILREYAPGEWTEKERENFRSGLEIIGKRISAEEMLQLRTDFEDGRFKAVVEKVTKIRGKYIQALEDEDFGAIPGATYVKAFLRTYAEYLDLDANALLQQYQEEYGSEGGPTSVAGRSQSSTHVKVGEFGGRNGPGDRLNPLWLILAIAGVAVLAILIWIALAGVPDISLFGASETTLTTV